jgi:hypothetical protein
MPWERFGPLVARWIPSAVILHPRPAMRFKRQVSAVRSVCSNDPYAAILPVRICAGGAGLTRVPTATVAGEDG